MSWKNSYLQYDDDALVVLANVGLLRRARKDVENQKVNPTDLNLGTFTSDGQCVSLDAQGIQKATCDCPATGCCKHILAAVLWIQSNTAAEMTSAEPVASETVLSELLALLPESLIKQTPKPDIRLALRFMQVWQDKELVYEAHSSQLKIILPEYDEPIIYMRGSGLQGMISSIPEKQKNAVHLAIIAKLMHQHGQPWQWPEEITVGQTHQQELTQDDKMVMGSVEQFIQDMLRQGLSHISQSSTSQLQLLNMSARAEGLPRLANYMKRLSQQVKRLADKHFTMDEGQVLRLIAEISAYMYQLSTANEHQLMALKGLQRRQYTDQPIEFDLLPIDANWWKTDSGAIGATLSFWDQQNKKIIQCTQGRGNSLDPTFNRQNVWQTLALWKHTAVSLMKSPFKLHLPRLSEEGKLSASGESYAVSCKEKGLTTDDYLSIKAEFGYTDWQSAANELPTFIQENRFSPILLHITDYEPLYWDETEQCVLWTVIDSQKNRAFLRLNWQGSDDHKIEELRFITKQQWPICAVTVQVSHSQEVLQLIPKTLWLKKEHGIELFYLDFESTPRKKQRSGFFNKIIEYMVKKQQKNQVFVPELTLASQLVRPLLSVLETQACTGRQRLSQTQQDEIAYVVRTLEDLGALWLANQFKPLVASGAIQPQLLLQLVYLCDHFERLQMPLPFQFSQ
ncbi:SWIM zinc finger family protein [Providencia rettgeri]|uniref:SWIM zinc finger family protein n=1 Tax=Providencia TaxID=586 RepID=UPI000D6F8AE2|nr:MULTISPECIES: SWIM zinc finger family protein [Providencia]EHZ7763007.1 SWIM zinc finger family protein [Providencia rettgeri]EIJ7166149.1 SWIM zinc finger family protein [Providencia rettgeri]EJD6045878.1 SWIM zinc finger family protein [Providencia rettgeri]ELR5089593.1 SWIM zinc finger family protein [Providencia rettgeri]ELR5103205.1 SWIM zinc finger family protein [Providencia rettgeri]